MASREHSIRVRDAAAAVLSDTTVFIYWHHTGLICLIRASYFCVTSSIPFVFLPVPRVLVAE
jgi:hypothetical protein